MAKTSKIHEEMVIKANQAHTDWIDQLPGGKNYNPANGCQRAPGYQGYQGPIQEEIRKYICINDESYISVFDVMSVFKDEIYEGKIGYNDDLFIYKDNKMVGIFKKCNFYSIAEMRDKKIDDVLNDKTWYNSDTMSYQNPPEGIL